MIRQLLPDLFDNDEQWISPIQWLSDTAHSDQAIAYAELFWPTFIVHEDHVLREGFSRKELKEVKTRKPALARSEVEGIMNIIHLDDLLFKNETWTPLTEFRATYIGSILQQTYRLKLSRDFPERTFQIEYFDGTNPGNDDISLSFWQTP